MTVTRTYRFHEVFEEEVRAINQRRRRFGRAEFRLEVEPGADPKSAGSGTAAPQAFPAAQAGRDAPGEGEPIMRPAAKSSLVRPAPSGGGVRSPAFFLGAFQAADQ